jgi:hypothetical protein
MGRKLNVKHDCGRRFCAPVVRMLWPEKAMTVAHIAHVSGVTEASVFRWADELAITGQRPARRKTRFSRAAFIEAWNDTTLNVDMAAERLGMKRYTCSRYAHIMGLGQKVYHGRKAKLPEDFNAMWIAGVSKHEIAQACGISFGTVCLHVRYRKLPPRPMGARVKMTLAEFRAMQAEERLAKRMAESARVTTLAYEITGRETRRHFVELKRLVA